MEIISGYVQILGNWAKNSKWVQYLEEMIRKKPHSIRACYMIPERQKNMGEKVLACWS